MREDKNFYLIDKSVLPEIFLIPKFPSFKSKTTGDKKEINYPGYE